MPAAITLLYPAVAFDLQYYLKSHMPLVQKTWENKGLKKWQVIELDPSSGHSVQCFMEWESVEHFQKAAAEDEAKIMGDIPNYTAGQPIIVAGNVVGGS